MLALAAGLVAGWVRRVLRLAETPDTWCSPPTGCWRSSAAVVRELPGGLDPGTVAGALLERLRSTAAARGLPLPGGSVHLATGDALVVLAVVGTAPEAPLDPAADRPAGAVLGTGEPAWCSPGGSVLLLPLRVGTGRDRAARRCPSRGRGPADAWPPALVDALLGVADEEALRLETALLFDDVRGVAISEERHRLAREIHDGIAQDLVVLGYGLDAALADAAGRAPRPRPACASCAPR